MGHSTKQKELEYRKKWYRDNKEAEVRRMGEKRRRIAAWFAEFKSHLKCERCPENFPVCLDFHHLNPSEKHDVVGRMVNNGYSQEKILAEVDKCIVLCSNCHRKEEHAKRICSSIG